MTIPVGRYADNSNDWLNEFVESQRVKNEAKDRVVQADYMSRLRRHIEEQQNAGKYVNVTSALEDFSQRLNLSVAEKTALASLVRYAGFDSTPNFEQDTPEKLQEEMEEQGAPQSILPGVKPSKKTNKQKINKDLAEDTAGTDVNGPETPLAMSANLQGKKTITANAVNDRVFDFSLEYQKLYVEMRVIKRAPNRVELILKTNKANPPETKTVSNEYVKKSLHGIMNLLKEKNAEETVQQAVRSEAKAMEEWFRVTPTTPPPEEIDKEIEAPQSLKDIKKELKKRKRKEFELQLSDDLDDVEVEEDEIEEEEETKDKKTKKPTAPSELSSPKDRLNRLKGMIGPVTLEHKELEGSKAAMVGAVTVDPSTLDANYRRSHRNYEKLEDMASRLSQQRKNAWQAGRVLNIAIRLLEKEGKTLREDLEQIEEQVTALAEGGAEEEEIDQAGGKLVERQNQARVMAKLIARHNLSEEQQRDPQVLSDLKSRYDDTKSRYEVESEKLTPRLEQLEAELIFYQDEHDQANLANLLQEKLPSIVKERKEGEEFDSYFKKLQDETSPESEDFAKTLRTTFNQTDPKQQKLVNALTSFLTPDFTGKEFLSIYKNLNKNSGFLTVRPADVQNVYEEQLASKEPVVARKRNQVSKGGIEYVASIANPSRLFEGYLPTDELMAAASVLLFGATEEQLLQQNREAAIKYIEEKRRAGIQEVLALNEHSLMANIGRLYAAAQDPENEKAQQRYEALMNEARQLIDPALRPYFIDPKEPIEKVITEDMIKQVIRRVIVPKKMGIRVDDGDDQGIDYNERSKNEHFLSLDERTNPDIFSLLKKRAVLEGYALESYDITLAGQINTVYMDQCSRFMGQLKSKRLGYIGLMNKHVHNGDIRAKTTASEYAAEHRLDDKWLDIVEKYIELYSSYLMEEVDKNYKPVGMQNISLGKSSIKNRYTEAARARVLKKIDKDIEKASEEEQTNLVHAKEALIKGLDKRKDADSAIIRAKGKTVPIDRLGVAANQVFAEIAKDTNFQVVTPKSAEHVRMVPDRLRKLIYSLANEEGKHLDKYSANALLQKLMKGLYKKATSTASPELDEGLMKLERVLENLGAKGKVKTPDGQEVYLLEEPPEEGENPDYKAINITDASNEIALSGAEEIVNSYAIEIDGTTYEAWIGTEEQIAQQLSELQKIDKRYERVLGKPLVEDYGWEEWKRGETTTGIDDILTIYPTSKAEEEALRKGIQAALSAGVEVATALGAKGVATGGPEPVFLFDTIPHESGEIEGHKFGITEGTLGKVDAVVDAFLLEVASKQYPCWAGTDEQIQQQISVYRRHREFYHARFSENEDVEARKNYIMEYATDAEAISKLKKAEYRSTTEALGEQFTIENLGLTPEEVRAVWANNVLFYLRDPSNPMGLMDLPGPPRSKWGKGSGTSFVAEGNTLKVGRKSEVYERMREWAEKNTGTGKEDKEREKRVRNLNKLLGKLESLQRRAVNYDPRKDLSFPSAKELFGTLFNAKRLAKLQRLIDIITGKEVSATMTADDAVNRIVTFVRNASADTNREKVNLVRNGRNHAILELTCPNEHENRTSTHTVSYIVGKSRMGMFNSASFDDLQEVADWAEEAVNDPDLAEEKGKVADRFKVQRFIPIGKKPACPICGFTFYSVDEELSEHLLGESGQDVIRTPVAYLAEWGDVKEAHFCFDWISDQLVWLENPDNKDVTREEAPFTIEDIEALPIAQYDLLRTSLVREILTSPDVEIEVDEEGNEHKIENNWEEPASSHAPNPYQHEWQAQLYEFLERWKRDLKKSFGFKDSIPMLSKEIPEAEKRFEYLHRKPDWQQRLEQGKPTIITRKPVMQKLPQGYSVGYEGTTPFVFDDDIDTQFAFYYDKDKSDAETLIPKGHEWKDAAYTLLRRQADLVTTLYAAANTGDPERFTEVMRGKNANDIAASLYLHSLRTAGSKEVSLMKRDAETVRSLLMAPFTEEKLTALANHLLETFGEFVNTKANEWPQLHKGHYSTILAARLDAFDAPGKVEDIVARAVAVQQQTGNGFNEVEATIRQLEEQYLSLTQSIAAFQQEELMNAWSWLTNKVIRVKDDKTKQVKARALSGQEYEQVKKMFEHVPFPTMEYAREVLDVEIEDEEHLQTTDVLLPLVGMMLKNLEGQNPATFSPHTKTSRVIGRKEQILRSFFKDIAIEDGTPKNPEELAKIQKELEQLILWSRYGYYVTEAQEIEDEVALIYGRYFPEQESVTAALKTMSEALALANQQCVELQSIRKHLSSKLAIHSQMENQPDNTKVPDPRFFYRVTSVTPAGIRRAQGPKVDLPGTLPLEDDPEKEIPVHFEDLSDLRRVLTQGMFGRRRVQLNEANFAVLMKVYANVSIRGSKYTTGSVTLHLDPILTDQDKYYPAVLGESTENGKVAKVPDTAIRPAEYTLSLTFAKNYSPSYYGTIADLRDVFENELANVFEFATPISSNPIQSKTSGVDYSLSLRRSTRKSKLEKLARVIGWNR